jgi:uncharacterized protein
MSIERRTFLKGSMAVAGGVLAGGPFQGFVAQQAVADPKGNAPFRDLRPIPDLRDGKVRLHLPEGFSYRSFHDTEFPVVLRDGTRLPGRHDGMGAFQLGNGNVLLVRNHELNNPGAPFGPGTPYDVMAQGGTTTVETTRFGEVVDAYTSLNGTMMNCSGGIMPWGSWITCEETVNGPDVGPDFTGVSNVPLIRPHGFVFEVPAGGQSDRRPITRAGRFAHEAVSFDPVDGILYLTEDNFAFPSGFYRYRPPTNPMVAGKLVDGGELQMLRVPSQPGIDFALAQGQGATFVADWVNIADPDPTFAVGTTNNQAIVAVGDQGRAQGAAKFSRLEGAHYDAGTVYFTSTQGGGAPNDPTQPVSPGGYGSGRGQVWAYDIAASQLRLVYESPAAATLDLPDNVVTTRSGALLLCEDNVAPNFLRGLTLDGTLFDFAQNTIPGQTGDEFAGATFGPDFHTLFVNIQSSRSLTFAIWGPWRRGPFG